MKHITYRSIAKVAILMIVTFGLYSFYWTVKTKNELKKQGAEIPSAILMIIPFAHIYFWYRYSEGFVSYIKKGEEVIHYFLLALLPFFISYLANYVLETSCTISALNVASTSIEKLTNVQIDLGLLQTLLFAFSTLQIIFLPILAFQMGFNEVAKK